MRINQQYQEKVSDAVKASKNELFNCIVMLRKSNHWPHIRILPVSALKNEPTTLRNGCDSGVAQSGAYLNKKIQLQANRLQELQNPSTISRNDNQGKKGWRRGAITIKYLASSDDLEEGIWRYYFLEDISVSFLMLSVNKE